MDLVILILLLLLPAMFAFLSRNVACALVIAAIPGFCWVLTTLGLWEEARVHHDCATGLLSLSFGWLGAGFSCLTTLVVALILQLSHTPQSNPQGVGLNPAP
jgi:hypothetical protein